MFDSISYGDSQSIMTATTATPIPVASHPDAEQPDPAGITSSAPEETLPGSRTPPSSPEDSDIASCPAGSTVAGNQSPQRTMHLPSPPPSQQGTQRSQSEAKQQRSVLQFFSRTTPEQYLLDIKREAEKAALVHLETGGQPGGYETPLEQSRRLCRDRVRQLRLRKREREAEDGLRDQDTLKKIKATPVHLPSPRVDTFSKDTGVSMAVATNPNRDLTRQDGTERHGKSNKTKQHKKVNWHSFTIWPFIDSMARECEFKSREIEKRLKQRYAQKGHFDTILSGTIQRWIEPVNKTWNAACLKRVKEGRACEMDPVNTNKKLLADHPEIMEHITTLVGIRMTGMPVNAQTTRNIVIGITKARKPEILTTPVGTSPRVPKFSLQTIRRLLKKDLKWSIRTGTQAAQKSRTTGSNKD
jgi:hypothetical protein